MCGCTSPCPQTLLALFQTFCLGDAYTCAWRTLILFVCVCAAYFQGSTHSIHICWARQRMHLEHSSERGAWVWRNPLIRHQHVWNRRRFPCNHLHRERLYHQQWSTRLWELVLLWTEHTGQQCDHIYSSLNAVWIHASHIVDRWGIPIWCALSLCVNFPDFNHLFCGPKAASKLTSGLIMLHNMLLSIAAYVRSEIDSPYVMRAEFDVIVRLRVWQRIVRRFDSWWVDTLERWLGFIWRSGQICKMHDASIGMRTWDIFCCTCLNAQQQVLQKYGYEEYESCSY